MKKAIRLGVQEKDTCFFGTLSDKIYTGANGIIVRYVDFNKKLSENDLQFKACSQDELIYIDIH